MQPTYSEFSNLRLVAIYDNVNPIESYRDFYLAIAAELAARAVSASAAPAELASSAAPAQFTVLDIGCGSGLLTRELADVGYQMIGLEPSGAMIELARKRPGCEKVRFVNGGVSVLASDNSDSTTGVADSTTGIPASSTGVSASSVDLAIMTGHVAQFFLDEDVWQAALASIYKTLKPGGHVVFESRNPAIQPWSEGRTVGDWPSNENRTVVQTTAGEVQWWAHLLEVSGNQILYEIHYYFVDADQDLVSINKLRFRSREQITADLTSAGFVVEKVFGDWDMSLATPTSHEFIFVASRIT